MSWTETALKIDFELSLPPIGKKVIAHCDGFRCLAYRNNEGKWIADFDHRELERVTGYTPLFVLEI